MADYYTILGVEPTASTAEIEAAYTQLARELDPKALPETVSVRLRGLAEAEFRMLQQAHRILTNPVTRTAYTRQLREAAEVVEVEAAKVYVEKPEQIAKPFGLELTPALAVHSRVMQTESVPTATDGHRSRRELWDLDEGPPESVSPWLVRLGVAIAITTGVILSLQWLWPSRTEVARQAPEERVAEMAQAPEVPPPVTRSALPTTGEITRFAAAAIAMRPLVSETDAALASAAAEEQAAILRDFETAAIAIVREHSLSLEEYHAIAQQVRETPALQLQVAQLASRLLNTVRE